jgi:hypothetical protein
LGRPGASNPAAAAIMDSLTRPRQAPGNVPGAAGPMMTAGLAGVASTAEADSIKVYNERQKYNEWEFVYDPRKDKRRLQQMPGQPANQPGAPLAGAPAGSPLGGPATGTPMGGPQPASNTGPGVSPGGFPAPTGFPSSGGQPFPAQPPPGQMPLPGNGPRFPGPGAPQPVTPQPGTPQPVTPQPGYPPPGYPQPGYPPPGRR